MTMILIVCGVIFLIISIIILIITNKKTFKIFKTNSPEEIQEFMKQHGFPNEMIQGMMGSNISNITTTTTSTTTKFINGQKVSEQTHNTNQKISTITNCPNCGATIEQGNTGTCRYCNTTFNTYQINNK